jgi:hypothetical protein
MEGRHERVGGRCLILEKAECGGDLHIIAILWGEIGKARKRMFLVSGFTDDVR